MSSGQLSLARKMAYLAIIACLVLLLFEMFASTLLIYRYRSVQADYFYSSEQSYFSSIILFYKAASRLGLIEQARKGRVEFGYKSEPSPFLRADPVLGVNAQPGIYTHTFLRKLPSESDWQSFKTKVSINEDGSRWTGMTEQGDRPSVYIFGDSFVFGTGVNDEQTFAYLVQQARPDLNVRLFAFGGYGHTEAYLRFERLKHAMGSDDVIVLGYAGFYDVRNVRAPSRLRELERWGKIRNLEYQDFSLPKAAVLGDGRIEISFIQQRCSHNEDYCKQPDPPGSEMTRVSASLVNHIADNTSARVILLHFSGDPDNPVFKLLGDNVFRLSALTSDFDYFIRDDVEGFDPHPGPYWHYAISRKVLEALAG
jgi:hypothetical protein